MIGSVMGDSTLKGHLQNDKQINMIGFYWPIRMIGPCGGI
jgi:hypothetical protein